MTEATTYPVRLSRSLMAAAADTAAREGIPLDQLIAQAVAEKLSALRTEDLLHARAARGDWPRARALLDQVGTLPPREGDERP